jgi:virginiamycin B lyase
MNALRVAAIACTLALSAAPVAAQELPLASLSGTVRADKPFQAAKVYLRNPARHVTYMVYTNQGRYRAVGLFPGAYAVSVEKGGFSAASQAVAIEAGKSGTADFTLRSGSPAARAVGDRAAQDTVLGSYEEIYPPGPARQTIERTCIRCHGVNWVPGLPQPREGWNATLDLMLNLTDEVAWGVKNGTPLIPPGTVSAAQRSELLEYLVRHFGADKPARMVRSDEPRLDEAALGRAMWVEYSVPEPKAANGENRWIQEPYFDKQGNVWLTERTRGAAAILRLDPRTAEFTAFPTPNPNWSPHGITVDPVDSEGSVWWAGRGVYLARLNPRTGTTKVYGFEGPGWYGGHTPVFDSKGDLWFSMLPDDRIGRWERRTDKIRLWENPSQGGRPYGMLVDQDDKVWYVQFYNCKITRFDPVSEKFTEYTAPSAPCTIRRLGLDSAGKIWYGAFSAGKLGVLDPATGKMEEYAIGRFSEPYDAWADPDDNIWMGDGGQGGLLIRFDQKTKRITNYPSPVASDMPKLAITKDGAIWYSNRSIASRGAGPATVGVLYPDRERIRSFGAYYALLNGRVVGSGSPAPVPRRH